MTGNVLFKRSDSLDILASSKSKELKGLQPLEAQSTKVYNYWCK